MAFRRRRVPVVRGWGYRHCAARARVWVLGARAVSGFLFSALPHRPPSLAPPPSPLPRVVESVFGVWAPHFVRNGVCMGIPRAPTEVKCGERW